MKKNLRIKNMAKNNEFSVLTGILAIEVLNTQKCLVTKILSASKGVPIQKYAYHLYTKSLPHRYIKISSTCGILNCVKKDHLIAKYEPTKKDIDYISTYLKIDGIEQLSSVLKVPTNILEDYLSNSNALSNS